ADEVDACDDELVVEPPAPPEVPAPEEQAARPSKERRESERVRMAASSPSTPPERQPLRPDPGEAEDRRRRLPGAIEIDRALDHPLVVPLGVAHDLLHVPEALAGLDERVARAPRLRIGADLPVLGEVGREARLDAGGRPRVGPGVHAP